MEKDEGNKWMKRKRGAAYFFSGFPLLLFFSGGIFLFWGGWGVSLYFFGGVSFVFLFSGGFSFYFSSGQLNGLS